MPLTQEQRESLENLLTQGAASEDLLEFLREKSGETKENSSSRKRARSSADDECIAVEENLGAEDFGDENLSNSQVEIRDDDFGEDTKTTSAQQLPSSPSSSDSESTKIGNSNFNSSVLLTIDPRKSGNKIAISFTEERAETSLSGRQGDHVTSYRVILEMFSKIMSGTTLTEVPAKLDQTIKKVIPTIEYIGANGSTFPTLPAHFPQYQPTPRITDPEIRKFYEEGVRLERTKIVTNYVSDLLSYYNQAEGIAYEKSAGSGRPGSDTSNTILALKAILERENLTTAQSASAQNQESFFHKA